MSKHTPGPWVMRSSAGIPGFFSVESVTHGDIVYLTGALQPASPNEANARLIAAAPQMLATLKGVDDLLAREGESANDRFERVSAAFHRDTGMLAPGKDPGVGTYDDAADRQRRFDDWYRARVAAVRAAITQAEGL